VLTNARATDLIRKTVRLSKSGMSQSIKRPIMSRFEKEDDLKLASSISRNKMEARANERGRKELFCISKGHSRD